MGISKEFKKTEIGLIPFDWDVLEVKEAYEICNNLRLPISKENRDDIKGDYPYYGPTRIQDYINEYRLDGEYALIGEDGDHFLKWYTMPMTQLAKGKFNVNNHAHVIKGVKNETSWFYWYFNHRDITPYLTRQGAGRYKLNKSSLQNILMAIPSKQEQQDISNVLTDTEILITSLEKLIEKKKKIKQGTMQKLLTGNKRLPDFSGEWELKKLGDVSRMYSGGTPLTSNSSYYAGDIPWITSGDLNAARINNVKGRITKLGLDNSSAKLVKSKTLLLALYGATAGVSAITEIEAAINQAVLAIIPERESSEFLLYKLKLLKEYIIKTYTQGGQPNLSGSIVKSMEFRFPKYEEQLAIAEVLSSMDLEISILEQKLEKYKTIKQGMMQELLTGRIRLI